MGRVDWGPISNTQSLISQRDRFICHFEKGMLTKREAVATFMTLLLSAPDDDTAIQLSVGLPSKLWSEINAELCEVAKTDFYWTYYLDRRPKEEVHQEAIWRQNKLLRIVPKIMSVNNQPPSSP